MTAITGKYRVNNTARAVDFFCENPRFDLHQPYQRGVVWGLRRQRNLIKSLLMGVPVPAVVLNNRLAAGFTHPGYDSDRCWSYAVVDGKQRVTALRGFLNNGFSVPHDWWDEDADGDVFFDDLAPRQQRGFKNTPIPVAEGQFATLETERELFDLLNFGGLSQGETDDDHGWAL